MGQVPVLLSYNEKVWTPPFRAALPTYSISWSPTKFARSDQMRKMRMKKNSKHYITCQRGHRLISFLAFKQSNHICWEIIFLGQKTFKNERISGHSWIFTKSGRVKWWTFTMVFYDMVKNPALISYFCDLNRWNGSKKSAIFNFIKKHSFTSPFGPFGPLWRTWVIKISKSLNVRSLKLVWSCSLLPSMKKRNQKTTSRKLLEATVSVHV